MALRVKKNEFLIGWLKESRKIGWRFSQSTELNKGIDRNSLKFWLPPLQERSPKPYSVIMRNFRCDASAYPAKSCPELLYCRRNFGRFYRRFKVMQRCGDFWLSAQLGLVQETRKAICFFSYIFNVFFDFPVKGLLMKGNTQNPNR